MLNWAVNFVTISLKMVSIVSIFNLILQRITA